MAKLIRFTPRNPACSVQGICPHKRGQFIGGEGMRLLCMYSFSFYTQAVSDCNIDVCKVVSVSAICVPAKEGLS